MPLYVWMPPYVWTPSCMFGCSHMFGCPSCLDNLCMFENPYVWMPPEYVWTLPYVWMPHMFGCLLYIYNTKKACLVRLRGCPYAPIHLDASYFGWPPVCLNLPICLDTTCMFPCPHVWTPSICFIMPPYVCTPPLYLDALLYVWMPTVCLVAPICVALLATLFSLLQCLDFPFMF